VGSLRLLERGGKQGPALDAVVWIPGLGGHAARGAARLVQHDKQFTPHVVVVGKGGSVAFPNLDRVYHNVFSLTGGSSFDLGLYKSGDSRERTFVNPGVVRVFCNIHPEMSAYVLVLDQAAPFFAVTDVAGKVTLTGLPVGSHRLRVWHEKGGEQEVRVDVVAGAAASFNLVLDGSGWHNEPHKNKNGDDYPGGKRY
jgi:plastocyanin